VVIAFVAPGILVGTVAAWGVDKVVHLDQVNRNVTLDGIAVGGMTEPELDAVIDRIAAETATSIATVSAPGWDVSASYSEAGIAVDRDATKAAVFEAGRQSNLLQAFGTWVGAMTDPLAIEPIFTVDEAIAAEMVRAAPGRVKVAPVEPGFSFAAGDAALTEGVDGTHVDPVEAAEALAAEVEFGSRPFSVDVSWSPLPPRFDDRDIAVALSAARDLSDRQLAVRINGHTAFLGTTSIRRWIDSAVTEDGIVPVFNDERVDESLAKLMGGYTTELPKPVFAVVDGEVVTDRMDGEPSLTCCGEGAADVIYHAAQLDADTLVALPTRPTEEDGGRQRVADMGVTELVGEFTTNHACCQNRVENIHRIADLVRGVVIMPGERFSVNDFVGPRTREKGFVSAGTIQQGHYKDDVGGGISQFATTTFNAAFFAGLELDDYKAHSIYISRYPYGREATLNYPDVDLAIINNTPYAVLIWTEYTDTSITVQMYSTHYWDVEQTGQSSWRSGACTAVETFRSRTNPEGETFEDSVSALYRPGEGRDCAGRATPLP
jgi:hypothetical protein